MNRQNRLVEFLRQEMLVPADAIALSLRRADAMPHVLPMVLWQYGFVTVHQLDEIFDWLEQSIC
ncbi:MAG: DUF2949 domain-containing protein [Cyanobacteria bacterium J06636_16]